MAVDLPQIDFMSCQFKWHGTKICYLSRGKLRVIAKDLGVLADGVKLQIYNRIVTHLEQNGASPEISRKAKYVSNF